MTVGRPLSHGCVRLYPEHAQALFEEVGIGETGEFIYEPVKAALDGEDIVVEVHPDFYGFIPDMEAQAWRKLTSLGVGEHVDPQCLRQALDEARGIPVSVGAIR
jgi:L,D-transpeptidase ErfK/SrfK